MSITMHVARARSRFLSVIVIVGVIDLCLAHSHADHDGRPTITRDYGLGCRGDALRRPAVDRPVRSRSRSSR